ncbi:MAG: ABC transporter ATP-binding protein [Candidatus Thorarchaeota archaeon]
MPTIEVVNITKSFEDSIAIQGINFTLKNGQLITLLGPSGSGKTTILRLIAGLIEPDEGQILIDNVDISLTPTEERNIGFVFQSYALFPHLTVAENIAFGLETRKWSKNDIITRVKEMLELVDLEGKGKRYPRELSGGEKSRVALARALAPNPTLLLLDEPLSALDQSLKESLRMIIREIQQKIKVSTIYVTHDQSEAMEISDKIILLDKGQIVESGTPKELYLSPKKRFTAAFLGIANIIEGTIISNKEDYYLNSSFGEILLPNNLTYTQGEKISIAIFPEHIELAEKSTNKKNKFTGKITKTSFSGASISLQVQIGSDTLEINLKSSRDLKTYSTGEKIEFLIPIKSILVFQE